MNPNRTRSGTQMALVAAVWALAATACSTAPIEVIRRGGAAETLALEPLTSAYAVDEAGASIIITDIDPAHLESNDAVSGQVLHVGFMWKPLPGRTAIDPTSTNVSLRLLVLSAGEAGLYGGGGFASVKGTPDGGRLSLDVEGSDLRLLARTKGFVDRLTPAELLGDFTVNRNEAQARRMRRAATQRVTNALGTIQWVQREPDATPALEIAAGPHGD